MSRYLLGDTHTRCETCGSIRGAIYKPLTRRQARLYDFLHNWIELYGYAPSFEEIAKQFKYRSLATVHEHLTNLEWKGWIRRSFNEARALECLVAVGPQDGEVTT